MNFSMPFLGNLVTYTKMMVFGTDSCVLCKPYWKSLSNKSLYKRAKWKKYFNNLVKYSKMCFQQLCLLRQTTADGGMLSYFAKLELLIPEALSLSNLDGV